MAHPRDEAVVLDDVDRRAGLDAGLLHQDGEVEAQPQHEAGDGQAKGDLQNLYYLMYSKFQKKIYKVSVFKIHILRFPLILAGRWNMGDMKVETL